MYTYKFENVLLFFYCVTGVTWVSATHGLYNYVMDSDGNIIWCASVDFLLVANIYVIFYPYEMFTAVRSKNFGCGM